jgi:hypothetical protein
VAEQHLPYTLPIEDVLACDIRAMTRIRNLAGDKPIAVLPTSPRDSLATIASTLGAYIIGITKQKTDSVNRHAILRGDDETSLMKSRMDLAIRLMNFSLGNLSQDRWMIRSALGTMGWVNVSDFALLEKLKKNAGFLTDDDLQDQDFRDLLSKNIFDEFEKAVSTFGDHQSFLNEIYEKGAIIDSTPSDVRSAPTVAISVAATGQIDILATWERLFISLYQPFATIHPAFMPDRLSDEENIKDRALLIGSSLVRERIHGYSIIDFWQTSGKVIPDDLRFSENHLLLPEFLRRTLVGERPGYFYFQPVLVLPKEISIWKLAKRERNLGLR